MTRLTFTLSLAFVLAAAACAADSPDTARAGQAPLLGAADGGDAADRDCNLVLRELARPAAQGGFATECIDGYCWFVWEGSLDIATSALAEGAYPEVMYQSGAGSSWWVVGTDPIDGAGSGFQRFGFRFAEHTVSPGMSMTSLMRTRIQVAPYLVTSNGGRLFDHNRYPGDFDNYWLTSDNAWAIDDDASVCQPAAGDEVGLVSAQVVTRVSYPVIMNTTLKGVVRVAMLGTDERVTVHYRARDHRDDSAPWTTVDATPFMGGIWEFETPVFNGECPHYCPRHVFQFAIEYTADGVTYWDNNGGPGIDYVLANDIGGSVPLFFGLPAILDQPVQLSYADWDADYDHLRGQIILDSLAYEKDVALVYSTDGWATVREVAATFSRMTYENLEYWRFSVPISDHGDDLRFAIRYTAGGETHWDNNLGRDYSLLTP
jgi:hypothetical protein